MQKQRIDYMTAAAGGFKAMVGLETYVRGSGLDHGLIHLVKVRASQINGCGYCIDMHWKDARAGGETEQRLYGLTAWREAPYYTPKERAALGWTEALTNLAQTGAPDADFEALRPHFSEKEIADLSWAIAAINAWNRMAVGMRVEPGTYRRG
ncbi:MAG TPA: carboxymuconolactone decarboxylase family protein [Tepidisphaeraceae bacterium]|nr:carboxymuconolactone decarboxylase family protein [Tepidisphaeraceae bacterium]